MARSDVYTLEHYITLEENFVERKKESLAELGLDLILPVLRDGFYRNQQNPLLYIKYLEASCLTLDHYSELKYWLFLQQKVVSLISDAYSSESTVSDNVFRYVGRTALKAQETGTVLHQNDLVGLWSLAEKEYWRQYYFYDSSPDCSCLENLCDLYFDFCYLRKSFDLEDQSRIKNFLSDFNSIVRHMRFDEVRDTINLCKRALGQGWIMVDFFERGKKVDEVLYVSKSHSIIKKDVPLGFSYYCSRVRNKDPLFYHKALTYADAALDKGINPSLVLMNFQKVGQFECTEMEDAWFTLGCGVWEDNARNGFDFFSDTDYLDAWFHGYMQTDIINHCIDLSDKKHFREFSNPSKLLSIILGLDGQIDRIGDTDELIRLLNVDISIPIGRRFVSNLNCFVYALSDLKEKIPKKEYLRCLDNAASVSNDGGDAVEFIQLMHALSLRDGDQISKILDNMDGGDGA